VTARITRPTTPADQQALADALDTIEDHYPFSPDGVFVLVSYGLPYFDRLPRAMVADHLPRLDADPERFALEHEYDRGGALGHLAAAWDVHRAKAFSLRSASRRAVADHLSCLTRPREYEVFA
jgi:hypothetical protein